MRFFQTKKSLKNILSVILKKGSFLCFCFQVSCCFDHSPVSLSQSPPLGGKFFKMLFVKMFRQSAKDKLAREKWCGRKAAFAPPDLLRPENTAAIISLIAKPRTELEMAAITGRK